MLLLSISPFFLYYFPLHHYIVLDKFSQQSLLRQKQICEGTSEGRWQGILIPDHLQLTSECRMGDRDGKESRQTSTENTGRKYTGYNQMIQVWLCKVRPGLINV